MQSMLIIYLLLGLCLASDVKPRAEKIIALDAPPTEDYESDATTAKSVCVPASYVLSAKPPDEWKNDYNTLAQTLQRNTSISANAQRVLNQLEGWGYKIERLFKFGGPNETVPMYNASFLSNLNRTLTYGDILELKDGTLWDLLRQYNNYTLQNLKSNTCLCEFQDELNTNPQMGAIPRFFDISNIDHPNILDIAKDACLISYLEFDDHGGQAVKDLRNILMDKSITNELAAYFNTSAADCAKKEFIYNQTTLPTLKRYLVLAEKNNTGKGNCFTLEDQKASNLPGPCSKSGLSDGGIGEELVEKINQVQTNYNGCPIMSKSQVKDSSKHGDGYIGASTNQKRVNDSNSASSLMKQSYVIFVLSIFLLFLLQ